MSLFKRLFFVATASKHGMQRNLYLRALLESSLEHFLDSNQIIYVGDWDRLLL